MTRWQTNGASDPVIGGRFRVLCAAIGWAYDERGIDVHPIRDMESDPVATSERYEPAATPGRTLKQAREGQVGQRH